MHKHHWHCYQGKTWWSKITCKGESCGENGRGTLLRSVYRHRLNIKLQKWLQVSFSFPSLMFPSIAWLLLFVLWSLKQDQDSFTHSTTAGFRQSHFCAWKMKISENAINAVCNTKLKLQCYSKVFIIE